MFSVLRTHLRFALGLSVLINLLTLAPTIYLLQVYDRVLSSRSLETLGMLAAFTAIAIGIMMALEIVRDKLLMHAGVALDARLAPIALNAQLHERARRLPPHHSQSLQDLVHLRTFLTGPSIVAFFDAPWLVIYLVIIFLFHWILGVTATLAALLLFGIALLNNRHTQVRVAAYMEKQRQADSMSAQLGRNAEVITVLGMNTRLVNAWSALKTRSTEQQMTVSDGANFFKSLTKLLRQLIQVGMMGLGAWLVIEQHATGGVMLATTILLGKALAPMEQMIGSWKQFAEVRNAWPRLNALLNRSPDPEPVTLPTPQGNLLVEPIWFTAQPGEKPILRGVGFTLMAGDVLAIFGPSASGKSTLVRILTGLWQPQSGVVRLDGADMTQWPREQLGQYLGYVPQEVELFAGTVAENIARTHRYAVSPQDRQGSSSNAVDSEAIIRAAQRAQVHELILRLPKGYETEIGESGHMLSGGQRQRIALARALYGHPKLVILDEPNANLDVAGEQQLHMTLQLLKAEGVTVIVVTHRTSLIQLASKVLILEEGEVKCFGPRMQVERWLQQQQEQRVSAIANRGGNL